MDSSSSSRHVASVLTELYRMAASEASNTLAETACTRHEDGRLVSVQTTGKSAHVQRRTVQYWRAQWVLVNPYHCGVHDCRCCLSVLKPSAPS